MKNSFLLLTFLACSIHSYSQEESSKSKLTLSGVSVNTGILLYSPDDARSLSTFEELVPDKYLQFSSLEGFEQSRYFSSNGLGPTLDLRLHFTKKKSDGQIRSLNPEYSIGLSFNAIEPFSAYYSKETTERIDTLRSSSTGEEIYIDSISTEFYDYTYQQDLIYLNTGVWISSNPLKRWRFYGGVGASIGYSFNARTFFNKGIVSRFESNDDNYFRPSQINVDDFEFSEAQNRKGISARFIVPLGISFRLSKDLEKQLGQCMVLIESKPNIGYYSIPELESEVLISNFLEIGFRYEL